MSNLWIFLIVLSFIVITYIFGILYYMVCEKNRMFILKTGGWFWFCVSGIVGVPFHEISHLIVALIFGHDITEIALFRPYKCRLDGNLGYVRHKFNPHSLWQTTGNFFIGIAPMLFGGSILLAILLVFYSDCFDIQAVFMSNLDGWGKIEQSFGQLFLIFKPDNFFRLPMLLLIVIAVFICPHLGMSGSDFKGVLAGTLSLVGIGWIIPFYLTSYKNWLTYDQIILGLTTFMIYYIYAMSIGLIISIFVMLFNFMISNFLLNPLKQKGKLLWMKHLK